MTQLPLLADPPTVDVTRRLIRQLSLGGWQHREALARQLHVSVRSIRQAAHESNGQILSGSLGLKLTVAATREEFEESIGRARSQISEMTERIAATVYVWESRCGEQRSA